MKRTLDVVGGTALLVLAAVPILVLALALAVDLRAWPFFLQRRIGSGGRSMRFLKLRTLPPETPAYALKHELDMPLSPLRAFLRRRHLDELPQLVHVLTGKLSLVGPRPRMPDAHEPVDAFYAKARITVPQGCTGLWQISDGLDLLPSESPEYDLFYAQHRTLAMDVWILAKTALQTIGLARPVTLHDIPAWTLPRAPLVPAHPAVLRTAADGASRHRVIDITTAAMAGPDFIDLVPVEDGAA